MIKIPQIFLRILTPFDFSFQFKYFCIKPVNVPANIITEQWPIAYTRISNVAKKSFVDAILNTIPSIGAIYAKVQGPSAVPNMIPRMNAANIPFFLREGIFSLPKNGIGNISIKCNPTRKNITATK